MGHDAILESLWARYRHHHEHEPPADPADLKGIARWAAGLAVNERFAPGGERPTGEAPGPGEAPEAKSEKTQHGEGAAPEGEGASSSPTAASPSTGSTSATRPASTGSAGPARPGAPVPWGSRSRLRRAWPAPCSSTRRSTSARAGAPRRRLG